MQIFFQIKNNFQKYEFSSKLQLHHIEQLLKPYVALDRRF